METKDLKNKLTIDNIVSIIETLGGSLHTKTNEYLIFSSLCHHIHPENHKPKLYYYIQTKSFFCFSCGSSFDIFSLIETRWQLEGKSFTFPNIVHFIGEIAGIDTNVSSITPVPQRSNWHSVLSKFNFISSAHKPNPAKNKRILHLFQAIYPLQWLNEGISIDSMKKYNIGYYARLNQTTIPCYDKSNNLVGVRVRNWNDGAKYTTLTTLDGEDYKFNTNSILYGLNINQYAIEQKKFCVLVESEKAVLKGDTFFQCNNCTLGMFGSNLNNERRDMIMNLGIETLVYAPDYDYNDVKSFETWFKKQKRILSKFKGYCNIEIIINKNNIVPYKNNAFDMQKDEYMFLFTNRLKYNDWINYCQYIIDKGELNE